MTIPARTDVFLATALVAALAGLSPAHAAEATALTLYRSDSAALYASNGDGSVDDGYAVVHEQRALNLAAGTQDVVIGDLPIFLDPEALALDFPGHEARVISQRLLLAHGANAALTGLTGHRVDVLGSNGESLVDGTLLRTGDGLLVRDQLGHTTLVTRYAAVRTQGADFPTGSSLDLRLDAAHAGQARALLSYPTSGLGWRAAYVATLQSGTRCRMQFESRASIANRSGRDWRGTRLTLIAGEPNMAKASAPRPMMAMARGFNAKAGAAELPQQEGLGDYRSYTLPAIVDLPDSSVSQVSLYAPRAVDCVHTALYENGNRFQPQQPMLSEDFNPDGGNTIVSTLKLRAFDSLPAGYLRVLTADRHGTTQFIGEGRIDDTPKGSDATITLGTAFDLRAKRTRTRFSVDKAGRTLDEAFRIELSNAGDSARTVTVREHPQRWRQWTLVSSSSKPSQQTTDTLEFRIEVPAGGKAALDYAVRYRWTPDENPQP
ncbi:DUF4139 domain-containing protein [Rhodanobacter ginsengisoli]|uniref:DUF4139 domain-containing protein n=1 Tax=Rhodanobacter ginsengisoli TaxID=418646 RepID=A0ABW0QKI6_9GAMM